MDNIKNFISGYGLSVIIITVSLFIIGISLSIILTDTSNFESSCCDSKKIIVDNNKGGYFKGLINGATMSISDKKLFNMAINQSQ